jgi:tetratricopeptide (TPR) repeat protein
VSTNLAQYQVGDVGAGARVAQGENITIIETINKIDLTNLPEFVKAFTDREANNKELLDEAKRKRDEIAADLQITQGAVEGFFQTLGEQNVAPERLKSKLIEIASQFEVARQRLAALDANDPATMALAEQARVELDEGHHDAASAFLERAEEAELAAAAQARALAQQASAAADARQLHAVKARESRGEVALTRLRYREAAGHFSVAVSLLPASSLGDRGRLLWRQANALDRQGDNAALTEAIAIWNELSRREYTRKRAPLDWAITQYNLGNALTQLGERRSDVALLKKAVAAYRLALQESWRFPGFYRRAEIQKNLGKALFSFGEREKSTGALEEAVAAFNAAVAGFVKERARTQHILPIVASRNRAQALLDEQQRSG